MSATPELPTPTTIPPGPPPGPPGHLTLVARQLDYWATVYRRTWRGSVVNSFVTPVLYLTAMGVLLGRLVDGSGSTVGGAPSYLHFVAPGILAGHAMQLATGEALWPVLGKLKWDKTFFGMISTPLRAVDIFGAHLAFITFRVATACAVFMAAMVPFGVYRTWWGALPVLLTQLLIGVAFATPFYAVAVSAQNESQFSMMMRLIVMPLFLFSGAFFPITNLIEPLQWVAWATPLWHGVELTRMFMSGPVSWPAAAGHATYLAVLAGAGAWLSMRRLERRLSS
ncbi:lipooligosaccharide transport system permease protein [Austwickia chelonae]|uniref:Transport permease protein n=1 Tax=Austwickia chelonae NBRC 105200 TaxID=1184607 RepID=K6VVK0_9MICO|nr:ABC transporter permease [Austwickia chelonae]GAB79370.1 putative ABC transporter permease protein [Austwickia chelonae NBRC 105200]SEW43807.1 lipooligosaccharide transport system permease protein [Austwickia chelonae]